MAVQSRARTWIALAIAPIAGIGLRGLAVTVGGQTASEKDLFATTYIVPALWLVGVVLSIVDRRWGWLAALPLMASYRFGAMFDEPWGSDQWIVYALLSILEGVVASTLFWMLKVVIDMVFGPVVRPPSETEMGCPNCGYDLTGNVSGICPECGRKVDPAMLKPPPVE